MEVTDVLRPSLGGSTIHFYWILFIKANHRPIQVLNRLHLFMQEEAKISSHLYAPSVTRLSSEIICYRIGCMIGA